MEPASYSMAEHKGIGDLLKQECYLRPVLMQLIDDRLDDCRLVCRLWNDVCKKLPVKLLEVEYDELLKVAAVFPNAAEIHTVFDFTKPSQQFLEALSQFTNLQSLMLRIEAADEAMEDVPYLLDQLTRYSSLGVSFDDRINMVEIFPSLQQLTNLTKLSLNHWDERSSASQLTRLQNIQHLEISAQTMVCEDGSPLLPNLTCLTYLCCYGNVGRGRFLEILPLYADTLETLIVMFWEDEDEFDWTEIKSLTQLKHLHLAPFPNQASNLLSSLSEMPQLEKLDILFTDNPNSEMVLAICVLTKLKGLSLGACSDDEISNASLCEISRLTQLTSLRITNPDFGPLLENFTGLIELEVEAETDEPPFDVTDGLMKMNQLEKLKLFECKIAENTDLTHLTRLRTVVIRTEELDTPLLNSMADLPSLTELAVYSISDFDERQLSAFDSLTRLSNLRSLAVGCSSGNLWDAFKEASFPSLRRLQICTDSEVMPDTLDDLKLRFPFMRVDDPFRYILFHPFCWLTKPSFVHYRRNSIWTDSDDL